MEDFLSQRTILSHGNPLTPTEPIDASPLLGDFFGGLKEEATTLCEAEGKRPQVEMITRDGAVTRLRLSFEDGDILELDCVYGEG